MAISVMNEHNNSSVALPGDLLQLIFDNLVGDYKTLVNAGLVCRSWRALSLPSLLKDVDLSSHNNGRLPELEDQDYLLDRAVVMSDYTDEYRPRNLVPRQRAFLHLMIDRPELVVHIKSFTWTLIWKDFDEGSLTDIDLRTWEIFNRMQNVTQLDLASLHDISDQPYIRQHPSKLFPAITHLRLVGWMHRGLVKAILAGLDATKLQSLELDHLQDEGALSNGVPIPQDLAQEHVPGRGDPYTDQDIDDELWMRQERGGAVIFPGPMWFPLRFLRQKPISSLAHLHIKLGCLTDNMDERNATTMFRDIAEFIKSAKDTLETITVELGEPPAYFAQDEELKGICGTSRVRMMTSGRPLFFDLASAFLHRLLPALTDEQYPNLEKVDLKGFRIILEGETRLRQGPDPDLTWQYIRACPFVDEEFTKKANLDYRSSFRGYDYYISGMDRAEMDKLDRSFQRS